MASATTNHVAHSARHKLLYQPERARPLSLSAVLWPHPTFNLSGRRRRRIQFSHRCRRFCRRLRLASSKCCPSSLARTDGESEATKNERTEPLKRKRERRVLQSSSSSSLSPSSPLSVSSSPPSSGAMDASLHFSPGRTRASGGGVVRLSPLPLSLRSLLTMARRRRTHAKEELK